MPNSPRRASAVPLILIAVALAATLVAVWLIVGSPPSAPPPVYPKPVEGLPPVTPGGSAAAPATPGALSLVEAKSNQVTLSWRDNSDNELGFRVERSKGGAKFALLTELPPNYEDTVTFVDIAAQPSATYWYRVAAFNEAGTSLFSNTISVQTLTLVTPPPVYPELVEGPPPQPPAAPTALAKVSVSAGTVTISWYDSGTNELGFKIERKTGSGSFVEIASVGANVTIFSDTTVSPVNIYTYRVRAYNQVGASGYSGILALITPPSPEPPPLPPPPLLPEPPTQVSAIALSATYVKISWHDNADNEASFRVERKTGSGAFSLAGSVTANTTSFDDFNASAKTTYQYRVIAANSAGESAPVLAPTVTTPDVPGPIPPPPLTAPSNLQVSAAKPTQVNLTWTDNAETETGFVVERKAPNTAFTAIATVPANTVTYQDKTAAIKTSYTYRVFAVNETQASNATSEKQITTPGYSNDVALIFSVGAPEIVFDYSQDRCNDLDLPDVYARAMRNAAGEIVLVSGNAPNNYFMFGSDFDHLQRNCTPVLISGDASNAASFDNQEWINAAYISGSTIYALVHNEFHDPVAPNCKPGVSDTSNACLYNSITFAKSTDGGHTFTQSANPAHLIAASPVAWNPGGASSTPPLPYGYFEPSNIVKADDGYYYSVFRSIPFNNPFAAGPCLARTNNLADPASWRIWNGSTFIPFANPYTNPPANPASESCKLLGITAPGEGVLAPFGLHGSLTFNDELQKYMLAGRSAFADASGNYICGVYLSLSDDLFTWGTPRLVKTTPANYPFCGALQSLIEENYPSIIDHGAGDPSFTHTDNAFFLYYMKANNYLLDRDLVRVPVTLTVQ